MAHIAAWPNLDRTGRRGGEGPHAVTRHRPGPNRHPVSDIPVPPECREMIARDALVAISTSGAKDSQAMTILISRIVPRDQLVAIHAPLAKVEWPGTIEHIERTVPDCVPLILAPVTSGKSLLDSIEERGRFPSASVLWCTSSQKRAPIERELRRYLKAHPQFGGRLVNAMGMRAEESAARASKLPWKRNDRNSRAGRSWFDWLPIFGLTETQVFDVIRAARNRRIQTTRWECRDCHACSASWPRAPICAPPRDCSRPSIAGTSPLKSASATRSRRPGCRCRF